jgi:hypothetical protein
MKYIHAFYFKCILFISLFAPLSVVSTKREHFSIKIDFFSQGIPLNKKMNIKIMISNAPRWNKGDIIFIREVFSYVVPSSNANNVMLKKGKYEIQY